MRWKVKPYPKNDDVRHRRRFAFFPMRMDDDVKVWLEWYQAYQHFDDGYDGGWTTIGRIANVS